MSFRGPDGNFISELMNSRKDDMEVSLRIPGAHGPHNVAGGFDHERHMA